MTTTDAGLTPAVSAVEGERLTAPPPESPRQRRRRNGPSGGFTPYALLVPASIVLAAIVGWPLIQLLVTSMQEFGRAQVFGAVSVTLIWRLTRFWFGNARHGWLRRWPSSPVSLPSTRS